MQPVSTGSATTLVCICVRVFVCVRACVCVSMSACFYVGASALSSVPAVTSEPVALLFCTPVPLCLHSEVCPGGLRLSRRACCCVRGLCVCVPLGLCFCVNTPRSASGATCLVAAAAVCVLLLAACAMPITSVVSRLLSIVVVCASPLSLGLGAGAVSALNTSVSVWFLFFLPFFLFFLGACIAGALGS